MYFLYNHHHLFHIKVPKILFLNSWLFPCTDDILLQETLFELAEHRSGAGVRGHVELHPLVREAVVAAYHMVEVLAGEEGLSHVLRCWLWMVWLGMVIYVVVSRLFSDSLYRINTLLFWSTSIIYFLLFAFIFFHPHNFKFFLSKHKILKIKEFRLNYFKFPHPNKL